LLGRGKGQGTGRKKGETTPVEIGIGSKKGKIKMIPHNPIKTEIREMMVGPFYGKEKI